VIDWELAPEGAVELKMLTDGGCARWFNKDGNYFSGSAWLNPMLEYKTIATRTQQKTVADAYDWANGEWEEGEKWTHVVDDDEGQLTKCRKHLKLCNGSDWVYVCEKGEYFVPSKMGYCGVKPIKPKLTKAQAWDKLKGLPDNEWDVHSHIMSIEEKYDIVEVPAND
jgi:hypothetical protein|tara:strand:- start:2071 stop:2571 length:501 start_codon:yes stop_codon:yes gene_type:complete